MAGRAEENKTRIAAETTKNLWQSGKISRGEAEQILTALGYDWENARSPSQGTAVADLFSYIAEAISGAFGLVMGGLSGVFVHMQATRRQPAAKNETTTGEATPVIGGADALLSFENLAAGIKPLFNEYVWWFVAMVLILSGSIMGIREAWIRFEGILRPLTILFAFFAYHTLFVFLGLFLFQKSQATGRMLAVIAACLLPVMFWVAQTVTLVSAEAGAAATAVAVLLSLATLRPVAKLLQVPYLASILYLSLPFALAALSPVSRELPGIEQLLVPAIAAALLAATGLTTGRPATARFIFASAGLVILIVLLWSIRLPVFSVASTLRQLALLAALAQYAALLRQLEATRSRFFTAVEISVYAVIALAAVIASAPLNSSAPVNPLAYGLVTLLFAIGIFMRTAMHHNAAIHPLLFLCMLFLYSLARQATADKAWHLAAFFVLPLLLPWFSAGFDARKKRYYLYWATAAGLIGPLWTWAAFTQHSAITLLSMLAALAIHRAAGWEKSVLHYAAALPAILLLDALMLPAGMQISTAENFSFLAILYAIASGPFERKAPQPANNGHPLDDISLVLGLCALALLNLPAPAWGIGNSWQVAAINMPLRSLSLAAALAAFLNLRSLRDRSTLVALAGNFLAAGAIYNLLQIDNYSAAALFFACLAFFYFFATRFLLRTDKLPGLASGRIFFFRLRLPFDTGRENNAGVAAALTLLVFIGLTMAACASWISQPDFPKRPQALAAAAAAITLLLAVFHFRTLRALQMRGNALFLIMAVIAIGIAAVVNRLGRPLPPHEVGLRMLLLLPVLAGILAFFHVYGGRYGKYLGAEQQGRWYFLAPALGIAAITLLEVYEVAAISQLQWDRAFYLVPPTFYLGLALYPVLLAHTLSHHLRHSLFLFLPFFTAAAWGARTVVGFPLVRLAGSWAPVMPGEFLPAGAGISAWLPVGDTYLAFGQRAGLGMATGVALLAFLGFLGTPGMARFATARLFLTRQYSGAPREAGLWSTLFACVIALFSLGIAASAPGTALLIAAAFLLAAQQLRSSALLVFIGGLLWVHGAAHWGNTYPVWPGPVLALAAVAMAAGSGRIARKLDLSEQFVVKAGLVSGSLYAVAALFYAATTGRPAQALGAAQSVLSANADFFYAQGFLNSTSLTLTFVLIGVWLHLVERHMESHYRSLCSYLKHTSWSISAILLTWLCVSQFASGFGLIAALPHACLGLALYFFLATIASPSAKNNNAASLAGFTSARDTAILLLGSVFIYLAANPQMQLPASGATTLLSLLVFLALNLAAAFRTRFTRYIYVAQGTLAGLYYSSRALLRIETAAFDTFVLFAYAFLLTGTSIVAGRYGITLIAEPTRRFAALMPLVVALVIDNFRSVHAVLASLVASSLYFSLSRLGERNLFAMLAAITLNTALFLLALVSGLDSSEFYAFPAGLTIIFFASIFRGSLTPENQQRVRTMGGLIAYLPAAFQVTLRSGLAENPWYSVAFGVLCLAGILFGMLFQVRSYLFLGTLFLTLDIIANLVQEGLQNQFFGFLLLTLTGLALIGLLIFYNLKKAEVLAFYNRLRSRFARWN